MTILVRASEMVDTTLTTLKEGLDHLRLIGKEVLNRLVRRNNKPLMLQGNSLTLSLTITGVNVHPTLKKMAKRVNVKIVKYDILLTIVPVKPLVLELIISVRVVISSPSRFPRT